MELKTIELAHGDKKCKYTYNELQEMMLGFCVWLFEGKKLNKTQVKNTYEVTTAMLQLLAVDEGYDKTLVDLGKEANSRINKISEE